MSGGPAELVHVPPWLARVRRAFGAKQTDEGGFRWAPDLNATCVPVQGLADMRRFLSAR